MIGIVLAYAVASAVPTMEADNPEPNPKCNR